ncbi:kinase-like domain-containing protein [Podospora aff. communis PSN243]|uniref:non-specific serine/threonine protein kinase n=1 Tax=Podospora aff. communis PSN243 TaxID=3040156 RepID=A0AAV9G6A5_9PEZI|nr:kinase-like domain-containing protein [Podospora aff. communis PSN243]
MPIIHLVVPRFDPKTHEPALRSARRRIRDSRRNAEESVGQHWETGKQPPNFEQKRQDAVSLYKLGERLIEGHYRRTEEAFRAAVREDVVARRHVERAAQGPALRAAELAREQTIAKRDKMRRCWNEIKDLSQEVKNIALKQRYTHLFHKYRRQDLPTQDQLMADRDTWLAYPVPARRGGVTRWPGPHRYNAVHNVKYGYTYDDPNPPAPPQDGMLAKLRARAFGTATFFRTNQLKLKWVKVLGWGGMGVAMLFSVGPQRRRTYYVVKRVLKDQKYWRGRLQREINILGDFEGAEHVAQLARLSNDGQQNLLDQAVAAQQGESPMPMLIMDYHKRGSLDKVIKAAAATGNSIHDRTLWLIFECLFRGLVAMRYPPKKWHPAPARGDPPATERIPKPSQIHRGPRIDWRRPGTVKFIANEHPQEWVHFDLDPSNFLVGDYNEDEQRPGHKLIPPILVNDFGITRDINRLRSNADLHENFHSLRRSGKRSYYTPEQFTSEWDFIGDELVPPANTSVAGQYNWRTNLWQVGQAMWSLITHHYPPAHGPRVKPVQRDRATGRWSIVHSVPVGNLDARGGMPRSGVRTRSGPAWSWGAFMLDTTMADGVTQRMFHGTDLELRELVMRCMMDDPLDRPDMEELQGIFERKLRGPWGGVQSDDRLRGDDQTAALFTGPAREPRIRTDKEVKAWLDGTLGANINVLKSKGLV